MLLEADWVVPVTAPPIAGGGILVEDGRIVEVAPAAQLRARHVGETIRTFPGCVLMPGLVNVHSHLEYSAFRGFTKKCGFGEWMLRLIAARRKLSTDDYAMSALWGAHECLRAGMTTIADTAFEGWTSARAARDAGLRARVYLELFGISDDSVPRIMAKARERLASLHDEYGSAVDLGLSPHATYTVGARLYRELGRLSQREGVFLATHLAESKAEVEMLRAGTGAIAYAHKAANLWQGQRWRPPGLNPVEYVQRTGALSPRTLAVHCVQVDANDIATLAACGSPVAHCPRSNQKLECGAAPISAMLASGVIVGLGTDSLASNDSLDMFAEMRLARELAGDLTAQRVLEMATIDGARALGWAKLTGSLETGKAADLIAVRIRTADSAGSLQEGAVDAQEVTESILAASPKDVQITMVAGKVSFDRQADDPGRPALESAFALVCDKL